MTIEEYQEQYFRRWRKRLDTQCWFIFASIALITTIVALLKLYLKELSLSSFFYLLIEKTLIPLAVLLVVMIPLSLTTKNRKINWKTGCRFVVWELFCNFTVVALFYPHYPVVLILPALTMLPASTTADKKLLHSLLFMSYVMFIPTYIAFSIVCCEHTFVYRFTTAAITLIGIGLTYKIARELLRSQVAQVSFIDHNYRKQVKLSEELQLETLTRLFNRRALSETVDRLLRTRTKEEKLCIAFFDLDNFKSINDTFGHAVGDTVLISLADIIKETLETNRNAFRYGGDEFIILFRDKPISEVTQIITTIMTKFNQLRFDCLPPETSFSMSTGIAFYKEGWSSMDWFKAADNAAYKAKSNGKNRYEIAD